MTKASLFAERQCVRQGSAAAGGRQAHVSPNSAPGVRSSHSSSRARACSLCAFAAAAVKEILFHPEGLRVVERPVVESHSIVGRQ